MTIKEFLKQYNLRSDVYVGILSQLQLGVSNLTDVATALGKTRSEIRGYAVILQNKGIIRIDEEEACHLLNRSLVEDVVTAENAQVGLNRDVVPLSVAHDEIMTNDNNPTEAIVSHDEPIIISEEYDMDNNRPIKVACFIQTRDPQKGIDFRTPQALKTALDAVKQMDVDILLFPELTYYIMEDGTELKTLFAQTDCLNGESLNQLCDSVLAISRMMGKAIVVTNVDSTQRIVSIYANAHAERNETKVKLYIKFTFTDKNKGDAIKEDAATFDRIVKHNYEPILYKGKKIGLTICADCERRIFSAGYKGIDILLNGTGGFVVDLKWRTHTRSRAIENKVFAITTMGKEADIDKRTGDYKKGLTHDQTYAFDYNGEEIKPVIKRLAGCVDVYEISKVTTPKTHGVKLSIGTADPQTPYELPTPFCKGSYKMLYPNIYEGPHFIDSKRKDYSVYFAIIENDDIFDTKKVLQLFEGFKEIDKYNRCVIINKWDYNCPSSERQKLITLLGAMALEMYACVVLEAPNDNLCIQVADKSKTKLKKRIASSGKYIVDLAFVHNGYCKWYDKKRDNKKALPNNSKLISRL